MLRGLVGGVSVTVAGAGGCDLEVFRAMAQLRERKKVTHVFQSTTLANFVKLEVCQQWVFLVGYKRTVVPLPHTSHCARQQNAKGP
jgi:hypothetical protein